MYLKKWPRLNDTRLFQPLQALFAGSVLWICYNPVTCDYISSSSDAIVFRRWSITMIIYSLLTSDLKKRFDKQYMSYSYWCHSFSVQFFFGCAIYSAVKTVKSSYSMLMSMLNKYSINQYTICFVVQNFLNDCFWVKIKEKNIRIALQSNFDVFWLFYVILLLYFFENYINISCIWFF